jgi:SAM-dependent methyltransferase
MSDNAHIMLDPTQRFSTRVENYIKFRPTYPSAVIDVLTTECGLSPASIIVDLGSGTGILTKLFLDNGNRVYGVEPNRDMREAGERLLRDYPNFVSVNGAAEATTLPDRSIDFIAAGQAFHWFDRIRAREECSRILRPGGWAVLVWNSRQIDATPFLRDYESLLQTYSPDYAAVTHENIGEAELVEFFGAPPRIAHFENAQHFDFDGLEGRLMSSSYAPEAGHPNHAPMLRELRAIFDRHQVGGRVAFLYDTEVYYGRMS